MSSNQTITFSTPPVVSNIQTSVNALPSTLNTSTVNAQKVFVGGVQIINPPNQVFQSQ